MIKGIIFDMDGTLLDSEVLKARAWKQALEEHGVENGDNFYRENIGNTGLVIAKRAMDEFSLLIKPEEILRKKENNYLELLKKGAEPIHSTMEFLKSMVREKIKLGLASSERKTIIEEQLKLAGVHDYFDVIVSGKDEVERNKPSPEIYLLTAKKLCINTNECVVIEDSSPGIEAAKKAGMLCIGYRNPHSGEQDFSKADFIVNDSSLSRLSGIFKYLFSTLQIMAGKIKTIDKIEKIVEGLRADDKIIVTTNGVFDILHAAHVNLFEKAKAEGDVLIVLLNNDVSVKKVKGENRPIVSEIERAKMIAALECVDYVVIFDNKFDYLKRIRPDVHVKGGSVDPKKLKEEIEFISLFGGKHKTFELEEGFSTTNIIERILNAYK